MGRVLANDIPYLTSYRPSATTTRGRRTILKRLYAALDVVAKLVVEDHIYLPIFERLEREIEMEEALAGTVSPVEQARAIARANKRQ
jgi:hypothetical protein